MPNRIHHATYVVGQGLLMSRTSTLLLALLIGCSTATRHDIKTERLAPEWNRQPFTNILVVGVYEDRAARISSESVFAAEMSEKAVPARAGYEVIPNLDLLDDQAGVRAALAGTEVDAILTIGTITAGEDFDYEAWRTQYAAVRLLGSEGTFTRIGGDIDYYESGILQLDIGLWDAQTLTSVWNAQTDSYSLEDPTEGVITLANFVISSLRERGLIPQDAAQ